VGELPEELPVKTVFSPLHILVFKPAFAVKVQPPPTQVERQLAQAELIDAADAQMLSQKLVQQYESAAHIED